VQALVRRGPNGGVRNGSLTAQQLRAMGFDVPDGYTYVFGGRAGYGTLMDNRRGFVERAAPVAAIGMGTVAGGLAVAPAVAGTTAGTVAADGTLVSGSLTPPALAAGTGVIPPAASAGGAGFMGLSPRSWLDAAIFGGELFGDIWGTRQQVGASDRAAETQLQANREALAFLREQWDVARQDFAPYLALGHASAGRLSDYVTNTPTPTMPANLRQQMEGGYDPQTYTPRPGWTPPPTPAPRPTPTPAPTRRDLDYWSARGMSPIGENGQLAPGWRRTAYGYDFDGPQTAGGASQRPPTLGGSFGRPSDVIDLSQGQDGVFTTQPVPRQAPLTTRSLADFGRAPVSTTQPVPTQRVRVQAPDGEIRELPIQQAAAAMRLGARMVA